MHNGVIVLSSTELHTCTWLEWSISRYVCLTTSLQKKIKRPHATEHAPWYQQEASACVGSVPSPLTSGNSRHKERMKMWVTPGKAEQPGNAIGSTVTFNLAVISQVFDAFLLRGEQTDAIAWTLHPVELLSSFRLHFRKETQMVAFPFSLSSSPCQYMQRPFQSLPVALVMLFPLPSPFIHFSA